LGCVLLITQPDKPDASALPEYISAQLAKWVEKHDVELKFIQAGDQQQMAIIAGVQRMTQLKASFPSGVNGSVPVMPPFFYVLAIS
jgi:hypothetical protein